MILEYLYIARRNNPKCTVGPTSALHYGANNDTKILLLNDTAYSTFEKLGGIEGYNDTRFKHLLATGKCGLE